MVAGQRLTATSALTPIAHATRRAGDCAGPAATIAGFVVSLMTAAIEPERSTTIAHLREVLGDPAHESFACVGEKMTTAAMATYAYDQIDQARAELNAVSK